jgi:hypothetical protein
LIERKFFVLNFKARGAVTCYRKSWVSRLIEGVLAYAFSGKVGINFDPTVVVCLLKSSRQRGRRIIIKWKQPRFVP